MCGQFRNSIDAPGRASSTAAVAHRGAQGSGAAAERHVDDLLAACLKDTRDFRAGDRLIAEGAPNRELFRLVEGELAASQELGPGVGPVLAFFYPGDLLFPAAPGEAWSHSVRALSDGRLEVYRLDAVRKVCQSDGRLAYRLFLAASRVLSQRLEHAARLRSLSVEGRFAAFLLEAGGRIGSARRGGLVLSLPMSRTDIASYLGLRTETLSRIIRRWRDRGLIDLESARRISIPETKALEEMAQDVAPCGPAPSSPAL